MLLLLRTRTSLCRGFCSENRARDRYGQRVAQFPKESLVRSTYRIDFGRLANLYTRSEELSYTCEHMDANRSAALREKQYQARTHQHLSSRICLSYYSD